MTASNGFVPALGYRWLTGLYDPVMRLTMREAVFKDALLRQADLQPGQDVLDLGCGTGTLTVRAAKWQPGAHLTGVDLDDAVLARARARAARAGAPIHWDRAAADALPYGAGSFDRVLSSLLLHHLPPETKLRALAEAYRVLRPGGELHVADWGRPAGPVQRMLFFAVQWLDGFANTRDHVAGRLPDLIRRAGFEAVEVSGRIRTAFGTLSLFRGARP